VRMRPLHMFSIKNEHHISRFIVLEFSNSEGYCESFGYLVSIIPSPKGKFPKTHPHFIGTY